MKRFNLPLKITLFLLTILMILTNLLPFTLAQDALSTLDQLSEGWNTLVPGGDTICSRGTPFQFFVRPAPDRSTDKLMVYFQGGGACWNAFTCRVGGTFDDSVGAVADELGFYNGIFDFANPLNPVADYNVVFVPYCTADVHVGDATVTYGSTLEIRHNGVRNTQAVLDWTFANFTAPGEIVITGSSAGAYGAIYHAPFVINQYPDAKIVQLGDAGVGATPIGWQPLEIWGMYKNMPEFVPALVDLDPRAFSINMLYSANAEQYPNVTFAQYTTSADEVQIGFYGLMTIGQFAAPTWDQLMYANLADLDSAYPNFYSYIRDGTTHTILAYPQFYTVEIAGTPIYEWFAALIRGEGQSDVRCETCVGVAAGS